MGNTNSRPSSECSDVVLASLSPKNAKKMSQPSYQSLFESAAKSLSHPAIVQKRSTSFGQVSTDKKKKDKRKWSSASEASSKSSLVGPVTPQTSEDNSKVINLNANPNINTKIEFEVTSGRRYQHSPGTNFFLPCDDDEADRLVIMHFLIKYAFNGNVVAPVIENLRLKMEENKNYKPKVLDVGCGPGTWILEMASEFPNSEFYGIDLRTMFPSSIKPHNAHFDQHDFFKNLPYPDETFEFVRMRSMLGFTTQTQLKHLLSEIQRVLKPSGYFEILDVEYQIHRPGVICETIFNTQLKNAMQSKGIELLASHHLSTLLMTRPADGGFIDVHQKKVTVPIGWGGQLGEVHAQNLCSLLKSIHPDFKKNIVTKNNGDLNTNIDDIISQAVKECTNMQSHMNWFVCYGQKPANTHIYSVTPPSSVRNLIPSNEQYPTTTKMISPLSSPDSSSIDLKDYHEHNWDTINDFVDGYID